MRVFNKELFNKDYEQEVKELEGKPEKERISRLNELNNLKNFIEGSLKNYLYGIPYKYLNPVNIRAAYLVRHNIHETGIYIEFEDLIAVVGLRTMNGEIGTIDIMNNRLYYNELVVSTDFETKVVLGPIPILLPRVSTYSLSSFIEFIERYISKYIPKRDGFIDFRQSVWARDERNIFRLSYTKWWEKI